jgi:transglutaminase/protease-like cytokinesis protein 3
VINTVIIDGMSELDKKFAILRWIITWSVYDPEFLSNSPTAQPNPNNDNPYGLLVDQLAICFGFAYTFQLFMDLLGIECITVHGYDFTGGRHVWNLIYIDEIWSAVDVTLEVTLNNPLGVGPEHVPANITHRHVNLSCDDLWYVREHRWDRYAFPAAVSRQTMESYILQ